MSKKETLDKEGAMKPNHDIDKVFGYWIEQCRPKGRKPVLDDKRRSKIRLALKHFTVEDLKLAIDGNVKDPFHQGENQRNKIFDELTLILRDAEHIEKFIDIAEQAPVATAAEEWLQEQTNER